MKITKQFIFSIFSLATLLAVGCGDTSKGTRRTPIRNGSGKAGDAQEKAAQEKAGPGAVKSEAVVDQSSDEIDRALKEAIGRDEVVDWTKLNETVQLKLESVAHLLKHSEGTQSKNLLFRFDPKFDSTNQRFVADGVSTRRTANAKEHDQKMNRYYVPSEVTLSPNGFTLGEGFFYTPQIVKGAVSVSIERAPRSNKAEEDVFSDLTTARREDFKNGSLMVRDGKYSITITRNGLRWMVKVDRQATQGKANVFQEMVLFYKQNEKVTEIKEEKPPKLRQVQPAPPPAPPAAASDTAAPSQPPQGGVNNGHGAEPGSAPAKVDSKPATSSGSGLSTAPGENAPPPAAPAAASDTAAPPPSTVKPGTLPAARPRDGSKKPVKTKGSRRKQSTTSSM